MEALEANLKEARDCWGEKRFQQAEHLYTKVLDAISTGDHEKEIVASIYNERGLSRYKLVDFDKASEDYSQAIELDPSLAAAYYNRGTISYRLCASHPRDTADWRDQIQKALKDFEEAAKRTPDNLEFQKGLQSCKDELDAGHDEVPKVLSLDNVPLSRLVKLLFLLDNGDETTGATPLYQRENQIAAQEAKEVFQTILTSREYGYYKIMCVLQKRAKHLLDYETLSLPTCTEAANRSVRKQDEDLLILAEGCHYLGIGHQLLNDKIKSIQKKMSLEENERNGNFYIYAENLLMNRICDCLTPNLVSRLFTLFRASITDKFVNMDLVEVNPDHLSLEGVKEALFFYTIRQMEACNFLNRIYTDKLQELLEQLLKECSGEDKENVAKLIQKFKCYPEECQPPGLCVVFCVTEDREGAESEIVKIQSVFQDCFNFTVKVERNPTSNTINEYRQELKKAKYRFYDSLVIWFVSHGDVAELVLGGKERYSRERFIDELSNLDNFKKKPKIFFMATCRGETPIYTNNAGGISARSDGKDNTAVFNPDIPASSEGEPIRRSIIPESCHDITSIYYQMDRIVAYSTLPCKLSFRLKDEGAVYVDEVCKILEANRGQDITDVLPDVCRNIHRILFKIENQESTGEVKQACYYESTFQKIFLIPSL